MARILAIDDDEAITSLLTRALARDGHDVDALSAAEGALELDLSHYDLILCDVMMPGMDGFELVRRIRDRVDAPVLFLTAKVAEEDAVLGLSIGADDYLRKPFGIVELRAKVAAHLRRENRPRTHVLAVGSVRIDLGARELSVHGKTVPLSPTEYALCECLARHRGQVLTRRQLREEALGWHSDASDEAISVHVSNARAKLRQAGSDPIGTVRGVGYRWDS